jgi:signal transduction histidine kinase/chemotaxis methyl-accepting protein methylase/ActR/RegA family two-component response regulator
VQRRLDVQHQFATALEGEPFESGQAVSTCLVLVIGSSLAVVDPLLEEVVGRRSLERAVIIIWQAKTDPELAENEPPPFPVNLDEASALGDPSLSTTTGVLAELTDGAVLEPGGRYHVPAHRRLSFEGTQVRITPRSLSDHRPIDRLLLSLAEGWGSQSASAIGVPLEEDGECGLRIVHAVGGLAIHRPALASRAKALAFEDAVTLPKQSLAALFGETRTPRRASPDVEEVPSAERHIGPGSGHAALVSAEAAPRRSARAAFRMTRVFSLPSHLVAGAKDACDAAVGRGRDRGRVRVWLPACKTGGMAYAVAMLLTDAAQRASQVLKVLVFGTDDDEEALAVARAGRYPVSAALGMDPDLRGRYTFDEGDTIRVSEALREVCIFSRHELTRDLPMARMDLIVCHRIFEGVGAAKRGELVDAFHYSLRDGGLLLALDHIDVFPEERFERVGGAYLRARPPRPRRRSSLPPARAEALAGVLSDAARISDLRPARSPARGVAIEPIVSAVGLPLILCDGQLRVFLLSREAQRAFGLSDGEQGASLEAVAPRLPGGLDLVPAAQRALSDGQTQELTVYAGQQAYLARISAAENAGEQGVSIAFADVTQFESASARAAAQRRQNAALARLSHLALTLTDTRSLCDEVLGVLFGSVRGCSAGIIVELAGGTRELEVVTSRGLGLEPLRTLHTLGDAAALLDAVLDAGCIVSQSGDRVWSGPSESITARERSPSAASRPKLASVTRGVGFPISAEGKVLGVVALYGRRATTDDSDHQPLFQAVANLLGGVIVRQRARRRLALELEVSRLLAGASDLQAVGAGLQQALGSALPVETAEIWSVLEPSRERWTRLVPSAWGASLIPPWPVNLPRHSGVIYSTFVGEHGELLVPIQRHEAPFGVLWLRGKGLRTPDAELSEGLQRIGRMLAEFLERLRILELSRQSEALHRQKSAELEALYASLPVGVSIHDRQGAIRHVNRHLAPLQAAPDAPGAGPLRRLYSEEVPAWVARVLASGEPIHDVELSVRDGDASSCWLCNFAPIRDADGRVHGASAVVQDITALKRVEVTLREADQQKDDFLAMLGHELRNPMAAIRNATELLSRIEQPSPQLLRLQSIFDRQTLQTTKLIDGLLDVARVARGKVSLQLAPVQVVELVRQAVDDRRQQFHARVLELRLPDDEIWAIADRVRLVQIVDNLISNALKFTAPTGNIRIAVQRARGTGSIRIEDDGMGIDADLLPQIFEPFRQGHPMKSQSQGLGLGLALVKGLVDLHGFRLTAHSDGADRGASFQIDFQLAAAPDSPAPESRVDMRALHLLLIEDNIDVAETLAELLASAGHRVEHTGSAEGALELLRGQRPDVVLCDIGLPGMDGLALAEYLRADPELRDLKLVAMTGFGDASTQSRIERAGFDRHLIKPVQLEALRHCLSRVAALPPSRVSRR